MSFDFTRYVLIRRSLWINWWSSIREKSIAVVELVRLRNKQLWIWGKWKDCLRVVYELDVIDLDTVIIVVNKL
jgi:hypothetical protein